MLCELDRFLQKKGSFLLLKMGCKKHPFLIEFGSIWHLQNNSKPLQNRLKIDTKKSLQKTLIPGGLGRKSGDWLWDLGSPKGDKSPYILYIGNR